MNSAEVVVVHIVDGNRCDMVLDLLGKRISQPSEAPDRHSDRQVLPLDITGGDMLRIWASLDRVLFATNAIGGFNGRSRKRWRR
jgi:hypothetical protein